MKKLLLLIFGLFTLHLSAQKIELTIVPNSVKVKNDSLYFKYKIQNNSDTVFVLYNIGIIGIELDDSADITIPFRVPRLSALISDKNGDLPSVLWVSHISYMNPRDIPKQQTQTYEESINTNFYGKYVVLSQDKIIEYDRRVYIGNIGFGNIGLKKGTYTFQLRYSSPSDYYDQKYKKAKEKDKRLKNSVLFKGEIKSNVCTFEYP